MVQLNDIFTNTSGFATNSNPVTDFTLSGNDLTITLQDGTSYTVDVTTLGVDENKFVSSGALFSLTAADDGTFVSGQVDLTASAIIIPANTNIAVVGTEIGAVTPNDGELAIALQFKSI